MIGLKRTWQFVYLFLIAVFTSIVLQILLADWVKRKVISDLQRIEFVIESTADFEAILYYAFDEGFNEKQKLENLSKSKSCLVFQLPPSKKLITNYRLDFGSKKQSNSIEIHEIKYSLNDYQILLNNEEVLESFFLNSESTQIDFSAKKIETNTNMPQFDPYIIFKPLAKTLLDKQPLKLLAILFPFLLVAIVIINKYDLLKEITFTELLMCLFITCIPLKIAWTTLATLFLSALALWVFINKRKLGVNKVGGFFLITTYILLILLGRPDEFNKIDHQIGLMLFGFIALFMQWSQKRIHRFYVVFFLLLNAMLVASGIAFLVHFKTFFGIHTLEYFSQVKTYSGNMRNWLYYDHAAFLSFFGLIGLLFLHGKDSFFKENNAIKLLYHTFLIILIVLLGVRISLIIYIFLLVNIFWNIEKRKRIVFNSVFFLIIATTLFLSIDKLDNSRGTLWSVSWKAIQEKPFFGHALGSSDEVLHSFNEIDSSNINISTKLNHSHNQFITFLLEIGFVGSIVLLLCFCIFFIREKQYNNKRMVLFTFAIGFIFLTESILQTSKPLYVLCFMFFLMTNKLEKEISTT